MDYLLAIDQGTSSTRAMVYTTTGKLIASRQYSLTQFYPSIGWVEQDPEEIWEKTLRAIREVSDEVGVNHIVACGITNQRETTLIWNKETGKCLGPAIVWQDRRTQDMCQSLQASQSFVQEKTGLQLDPYFSATKLNWLLNAYPEAQALAKKNQLAFGTIDSFLIWCLTAGKSHFTDITNASRTLLYNIHTQAWDESLLQLFSIPANILPQVLDCDANFGTISPSILEKEIPITGVAGDQQAALIGQGCLKEGMIKATYGTGGFLLLNTGSTPVVSKHKLLTTIAYRVQGSLAYGLEGSIYQAGTTIKWLRDELKLFSLASDSEVLAASLESNEGVYLVPSFTGMGAPHWLSSSGAIIVGLSRKTNRAHLARAALESVCYQTLDVLVCMREDTNLNLSILRVDGGMTNNAWLLQFLASSCNIQVQRPHDTETTALGAAMLAAIGIGAIPSIARLQEQWSCERAYAPEKGEASNNKNHAGWLRALKMFKAGEILV